MVTDTTSSDDYLSDHSIEWPVPPASRGAQIPPKAVVSGLRENPASANRGSGKAQIGRSMDSVVKYGPRTDSLLAPPISSPWIAEGASNSNQAGDLYFKVEM